ncbi:MAG: M64 family metallopeptidase [Planctomycetota bacterium]
MRCGLGWAVALVPLASAQTVAPASEGAFELVYYDTLDEHGNLTGGATQMWLPSRASLTGRTGAPHAQLSAFGGNPANRIDFVFVGDGYTSAQLGTYATHVNNVVAAFFNRVPYSTYRDYFTVHRIDVVSVDSGVDHDPTQGILKNTALDMRFWCSGTERLLCVNVNKAYNFANNAPDVDLVAALANSTMYGGAGYPGNDLGTCAAASSASVEILQHEFGHALGNLADEYDYGGSTTYSGPEPSAPNVSKLLASAMLAAGTKWASWLGTNQSPYDGLVDTFEGANYSAFGIYRPTSNSLMRSLGRPFNLPSIEALIIEMYKIVDPIDTASSTLVAYDGTETLFVTPMVPVGHSLVVQWSLDGIDIPGATGTTLDLGSLGLGPCDHTVSVTVRDNTTLVRNETARAQWMTQTREYFVSPSGTTLSTYCVAAANTAGPGALIGALGSTSLAANDLVLTVSGCPPFTNGYFFWGLGTTQTTLGNGFLCVQPPIIRMAITPADATGAAAFAFPAPNWSSFIVPGTDVYFQYWYRNVAAGGALFNVSNGLKARFCN